MHGTSGGGASAGIAAAGDSVVYPELMTAWYQAALCSGHTGGTGTPPTPLVPVDTLTLSVTEVINRAMSDEGGNPYEFAVAFDPNSDLSNAANAVNTLISQADGVNPSLSLAAALQFALNNVTLSDVTLGVAQTLTDFVDANSLRRFKREVAQVSAGLFDIGAVMTTQFHQTLALMEHDRRLSVGNQEIDILNHAYDTYIQNVFNTMERYLQENRVGVDARRVATEAALNMAKLNITAHQDQIEFDLEHLIKKQTWDLELFGYGTGVFSSITGAATMPRPQTRRERQAGALMTSLSAGMQTMAATGGNPLAGAGVAVATYAAQMIGMS